MAIVKLEKNGYGQLELNNVAFRRDGRIEAQCALDGTDFSETSVAENGMLLAIDNVKRVALKATAALAADLPVALHYSTEHMYDERKPGLKNFALRPGEFYPRSGYLAIGDKFHTNTVCYDTAVFATEDVIKTDIETGVYAMIATDGSGYWELVKTIPVADGDSGVDAIGPIAKVVEYSTMPDGQTGLKLQVIRI